MTLHLTDLSMSDVSTLPREVQKSHFQQFYSYILILLVNPFNCLFSRTTQVSQFQKGKTSLDLNAARDYAVKDDGGFSDGSGNSWTICKQFACRSSNILMIIYVISEENKL